MANPRDDLLARRTLPDGRVIGVHQFIFTWGLLVDVGEDEWNFYAWRYCYEDLTDALKAVEKWDGKGDPPGPWIKLKGHPEGERLGPGAIS